MKFMQLSILKVIVPFDANRLASRVKNIKDTEDDAKLQKFFEPCHIGHVSQPATVLDTCGSILVWYLPDILTSTRIVSGSLLMAYSLQCVFLTVQHLGRS
jgi:hypothetical protein